MKKFLASAFASLLFVSAAAFALPTVQQIESAMSQGNWQQADIIRFADDYARPAEGE